MIKRWLAAPHVREWWGDPAEQSALVSGDLDEPAMDQYIVSADGRAFGYLQCYDLTAWNSGFGEQPKGTRGIDLFIGEIAMIEGGHGRRWIRALCRRAPGRRRTAHRHRSRSEQCSRACAPMRRPGFARVGMVETPDGPSLLMVRDA